MRARHARARRRRAGRRRARSGRPARRSARASIARSRASSPSTSRSVSASSTFSRAVSTPGEARHLADDADAIAAERRALVPVERREHDAVDDDLALVRRVEAGEQREERRLARAGRAGDDRERAGREHAVEALEGRLVPVAPRHAARLDEHAGGGQRRLVDDRLGDGVADGRSQLDGAGTHADDRAVADAGGPKRLLGDAQPAAAADDDRLLARPSAPRRLARRGRGRRGRRSTPTRDRG